MHCRQFKDWQLVHTESLAAKPVGQLSTHNVVAF